MLFLHHTDDVQCNFTLTQHKCNISSLLFDLTETLLQYCFDITIDKMFCHCIDISTMLFDIASTLIQVLSTLHQH